MNEKDRQNLVQYRINKARNTLDEVTLHVENGLWNTAINRLYYACYYSVIALLINDKINAATHAGVRRMFGLHFVKTGLIDRELGRFYSDIFDMRQTGDYEDYIDYSEEDVLDLLMPANKLISKVEALLNIK